MRKALEQPSYAVRVAMKRLFTSMAYRCAGGRAPLPEAITVFLTHRCNLRCKMCGQWGEHGVTRAGGAPQNGGELTIADLKRFIAEAGAFNPSITLFGGEPFFHRDIIPLIETIKAQGLHCLVITNGSLLKPHAASLVRLGLDELNLSLDGNRDTHNEIRGMQGLFERIVEGIEEINHQKKLQGRTKPLINLQCTISKDNYARLEEMLAVAERLHANSLTFHHLIFMDEATYCSQEETVGWLLPGTSSANWKGFVFESGIDPRLLLQKMDAIRQKATKIFVNFYPNFSDTEVIDYYENPRYLPKSYRPRCLSPWITAYVFPTGDVRPCLNLDYSFGNIKDAPFSALWNGEQAVRYRRILKERKLFPACIRCTELFRY